MGLGLWAPSVRDSVAVNRVLVSTLTSRGRCVASSGPSFSSDLRVVLPDSPDPPRSREPFLLCPAWWRWRQREAEQQWPQALCLAQPFPIPFGCHRVRWPLPPKHQRLRCTAESLDPPSFALWPQAPPRSSPPFLAVALRGQVRARGVSSASFPRGPTACPLPCSAPCPSPSFSSLI